MLGRDSVQFGTKVAVEVSALSLRGSALTRKASACITYLRISATHPQKTGALCHDTCTPEWHKKFTQNFGFDTGTSKKQITGLNLCYFPRPAVRIVTYCQQREFTRLYARYSPTLLKKLWVSYLNGDIYIVTTVF